MIIGTGTALIGTWTRGFSAFTSYSYALGEAGPVPRAAPDIPFVDQFGQQRRLASLQGRYVLLHVFYGSCGTICPLVIEQLREFYSALTGAQRSKLAILSISVDPRRDTPDRLRELWRDEGAFEGWIMAQPVGYSLDPVEEGFGIWVLARRDGRINHSANLFLIDPRGRTIRVFSPPSTGERLRRDIEAYL